MSTQKTTLLLVEDDQAIRYLLSIILSSSGYEVRTVQDGFSALVAIRNEMPDILLSDLYMPGMSGFELLSVVRRRFPLMPVVAMSSAYSGPQIPAGVMADAFYEKATDPNVLLGLLSGMHEGCIGCVSFPRDPITPIWIPCNKDNSERTHVTLSCPECLRTFSYAHSETVLVVHETRCQSCLTPIAYALVQATTPPTPERLLMGVTPTQQAHPATCAPLAIG
jgi:CheY-like chemotaxis protein